MTSIVYDGKRLITDSLGIVGTPDRHVALSKPVRKIHTYGAVVQDVLENNYEVRIVVSLTGQQTNVTHMLQMVKCDLYVNTLPKLKVFLLPNSKFFNHQSLTDLPGPAQLERLKHSDALALVRIKGRDLNKDLVFVMAEGELSEVDEPCWAVGYSYAYFIMGMRLGHDAVGLMAHIAGKYEGTSDKFAVYDLDQEFEKIELEPFLPTTVPTPTVLPSSKVETEYTCDPIPDPNGASRSVNLASKIRAWFYNLI